METTHFGYTGEDLGEYPWENEETQPDEYEGEDYEELIARITRGVPEELLEGE